MDYQKIYDKLIERGKTREKLECYIEKHHVVPVCMNGPDTLENLVELTPEEHYLAHQLLVRIYPDNDKLLFAAHMMCSGRPTNKLYGWLRRRHAVAIGKITSKRQTGSGNSNFNLRWISNCTLKKNDRILIGTQIPAGWIIGRNKWKADERRVKQIEDKLAGIHSMPEHICKVCRNQFSGRKRLTCSIVCQRKTRPNGVADNFDAILAEYSVNGKVLYKAFKKVGLGFNADQFKKFYSILDSRNNLAPNA